MTLIVFRRFGIALWVVFSLLPVHGQGVADPDRHMVFFTDKESSPFRLDSPEEFLSPRALRRRQLGYIAVTSEDFPVNASYVEALEAIAGIEVYHTSRWMNAALVQAATQAIDAAERLPFVKGTEFVGKGGRLSRLRSPFGLQEPAVEISSVSSNSQHLRVHGLHLAHRRGFRGEGIWVAVFDDGFLGVNTLRLFRHVFHEGRMAGQRDFVTGSGNPYQHGKHGTAVAALIASDDPAVMGSSPGASLVLCVTEDNGSEYRVEEYNWLFAAEYADSLGVDVINSSLGYFTFDDPSMDYQSSMLDGRTTVVSRAAALASRRGMIVVNSVGNIAQGPKTILAPADVREVVSVGAVDEHLDRIFWSAHGPTVRGYTKPDLVTPVLFRNWVWPDGTITKFAGTSGAAPIVAGFMACALQRAQNLLAEDLVKAVKASTIRKSLNDEQTGSGIPHFLGFERQIEKTNSGGMLIFPNPATGPKVNLTVSSEILLLPLEVSLVQGDGRIIFPSSYTRFPGWAEVEIEGLRAGVYWVRIASHGGHKTARLIVH